MRTLLGLLALLGVLAPVAHSEGLAEAEHARLEEAAERILRAGLTELRAHRMLAELCATAPDRLSGSAAIGEAEAWAERAMQAVGLTNVRREAVTVPHWVRGEREALRLLSVHEAGLGLELLPIRALGGSVGTPEEGITAEVVEVRSFEELKERASEAKGRIVFFNRPMDPTLPNPGAAYGGAVGQRTRGAVEAAKVGGVAAIVRSLTTLLDDVPHTGVMRYEEGVARVPAAAVSTKGAERISAVLAAGGSTRLVLHLDCRNLPDTIAHTIVGELEGTTKKDEIVLLGAHLDAWDVGQGAHDDGAGCVHVLEAVRLLLELGFRPKRTLRVVLYACEEQGVFGGRAYAQAHGEELAQHVAAIESDGGGFSPRGFSTNAGDEARAILADLASVLEPIGANRVTKGGGGADIGPLGPSGVVLLGLRVDGQRYFDYHHARTDTIDEVNERELELGAIAIATLAYAVADRDEPLPRNPEKP